MIVFASSLTKPDVFERCAPDVFERCAGAGFGLVAEPDSEILPYDATGSIFRSYNLLTLKARGVRPLPPRLHRLAIALGMPARPIGAHSRVHG